MPRQERKKSALGIYHVMLRGINKQDIFFKEDDFVRMMTILRDIPYKKNKVTGEIISSSQCTIYAYCILHNHLHILIKEGDLSISEIMKSIEDRYALYYNKKYERVGHLFQSRFPSEAIDDAAYFHTVIRYIARNPVKAMESQTAEEYPYSSWNEYVDHKSNIMKVLKPTAIQAVLSKFPLQELIEWINESNQDSCLDMDTFYNVKSEQEAWDILSDSCGIDNPEDFRTLDPQQQIFYLLDAIEHGVSLRQAARLGTITRYQLTKAYHIKFGESSATVSVPVAEESLENTGVSTNGIDDEELQTIQQRVRRIIGLGKQTYHRLHLIVEFMHVNGDSKCAEVAEHLGVSTESARKCLVQLANENVVDIIGSGKQRIYRLRK